MPSHKKRFVSSVVGFLLFSIVVCAFWLMYNGSLLQFRSALPPDISSRPPFIISTNPYPVVNVAIGNEVRIMLASLKAGHYTRLDGTLQTIPITSTTSMPPGMRIDPITIDVPSGSSSIPVQVYQLSWVTTAADAGDHPVTLSSTVTIGGTTYTADPYQITFHVFDGAGGSIEELTNQEILARLIARNLTTATSVPQLLDSLSFERVYQRMDTDVLLAALIRQGLAPGYSAGNPRGEAARLKIDLRARGVDVDHLRPDGLLTKLAAMTGSLQYTEPMVLTGTLLDKYRYWEAPLAAKNILKNAMSTNTGAFLEDFAPRDLVSLFDDSISPIPGSSFSFYISLWIPERLKTVAQPSFCPVQPPFINGDPDALQLNGRMLCVAKMRPEYSIEGTTQFINSARPEDETVNDAVLRSIARRMARDLKKMPPGSRIMGMHGHTVQGTLLYRDQNNQPASVGVDFDDGLTDYIYPRNYPDVTKRFQPYQKSLVWMDEWENIIRNRMDRFFPMLREEIDAIGASLDGVYIDVENKALSLAELGEHTNPDYAGPNQDVYQMLRTDARWPEVSRRLADAGVCPLDDTGICPITAAMVTMWRTDERHSKWNAVMEKRRAEYVNRAIADPLHTSFPNAEFFNYGNYNHTAMVPFANCNRFSDSCFGVGTVMNTHQSVNLYGYIRDSIMPDQSQSASSGARIRTFEAANGIATITMYPEINNPQFGTLNAGDLQVNDRITLVNLRNGCLDAPYTPPQCPPPPGGSTSCTPGEGTCSNCAKALLLTNGCVMPEDTIIRPGVDPVFGPGFGTGEYLVRSIDPATNSITVDYPATVPRITLYDNISTTIYVRKQYFRTSGHSEPQSEIKILRMKTTERMVHNGVSGSGVAMILSEPWKNLSTGQFLFVSNRSGTDYLPTSNGAQIEARPYEGKYEILGLPNSTTILSWTGATLLPADLSVFNTQSLYANMWRSWNAFAADIMQMRSMASSTTYGINPWIQHVDTTTEKNTSDRYDDVALGDSDDPWKYYSESVFHIYLNGANRIQDWIWSKFSDDSVQQGNDLLNRTLNEVEKLVGYDDRESLSFEPVRWTDDYILTGMEAGGKRVYRLTPNELKWPVSTWNVVSANPARIILGTGSSQIDVPLPPNSFVCTPTYKPAPCPQNPVSNYGYWIIQYQSWTMLRGTVDDIVVGLQ